jgi:invasion protein IalB
MHCARAPGSFKDERDPHMLRRWVFVLAVLTALGSAPSVVLADCKRHEERDRSIGPIGLSGDLDDCSTGRSREEWRAQVGFAGARRLAENQTEHAGESSAETQATANPWVKLCENVNIAGASKALCVTTHERLDGSTGMVLVSAALREIEGDASLTLMALVPEGVRLPPGLRISIYSKEDWEKLQRHENDESKATAITLTYTLCRAGGCAAEATATPSLIADLKAGGGLRVSATGAANEAVSFLVPLVGFTEAYEGPPEDNERYKRIRSALLQQIKELKRAAGVK